MSTTNKMQKEIDEFIIGKALGHVPNWSEMEVRLRDLALGYDRKIDDNRTIEAQTSNNLKRWFVEQVFEYEDSCDESALQFVRHIGLEDFIPEKTYTVTVEFTTRITDENEAVEALEEMMQGRGDDIQDWSVDNYSIQESY